MRARRIGTTALGTVAGFAAGAVITLSLQGTAKVVPDTAEPAVPKAFTVDERPDTFLAWTAGGLPAGFSETVASMPEIRRSVTVASDVAWLTRSLDETGEIVDDPPPTFSIPLEVAAVEPDEYAPFLPPADRSVTLSLEQGHGVLGETSAKVRGLGQGAVLRFADARIEIAAILPDELVGAHELLVSRDTGLRIGVEGDRYALLVPEGEPDDRELTKALRRVLPPGTLLRVRAPGETPYFRHGDAVLPPVRIKELFGEFAAKPRPGWAAGFLSLDPRWVRTSIVTQRVRLLGPVTCHVAMFPQIRAAVSELIELGLQDTITSYSGCFAPRHINRDPGAGLSHHAWGIALDINVPENLFGDPPNQDPRLVEVFERWGFIWGGDFIEPDGMHFEYRRPPAAD